MLVLPYYVPITELSLASLSIFKYLSIFFFLKLRKVMLTGT